MRSPGNAVLAAAFTRETAILKIRAIEDKWNSRNPEQVRQGYAADSYWLAQAVIIGDEVNGRYYDL